MSTAHTATPQLFNVLAGRREMLIDDVTEAEADAVVARWGSDIRSLFYLPEVRKEIVIAKGGDIL